MHNNELSLFATCRAPQRLICVWVPTRNPKMPLTCVWIQDKHYPTGGFVGNSIQQAPVQEDERMQPCLYK